MFRIIAAVGKNREIGYKGGLVFHLREDMQFFRQMTLGHSVVMGRKTWESLGRRLPGRENIVVSRSLGEAVVDKDDGLGGASGIGSVDNVTNGVGEVEGADDDSQSLPDKIVVDLGGFVAKNRDSEEEIFVIGGEGLYEEMLDEAKTLYLTEIEAEAPADRFFPDFDKSKYNKTIIKRGSENDINYSFVKYERK